MGIRLHRVECRNFFGSNCYSWAVLALCGAARVASAAPESLGRAAPGSWLLWESGYPPCLPSVRHFGFSHCLGFLRSVIAADGHCLMSTVSLAELILQRGSCLSGQEPI
jgi:hypothetical protein